MNDKEKTNIKTVIIFTAITTTVANVLGFLFLIPSTEYRLSRETAYKNKDDKLELPQPNTEPFNKSAISVIEDLGEEQYEEFRLFGRNRIWYIRQYLITIYSPKYISKEPAKVMLSSTDSNLFHLLLPEYMKPRDLYGKPLISDFPKTIPAEQKDKTWFTTAALIDLPAPELASKFLVYTSSYDKPIPERALHVLLVCDNSTLTATWKEDLPKSP